MISGDGQVYATHPVPTMTKVDLLYKCWKTEYSLPNHKLKVYDYYYDTFKSVVIKDIVRTGVRPVYNVTLENGKSLKCSHDTLFLTKDGFYEFEEDMEVGTIALVSCCDKPKYSKIVSIERVGEKETFKIDTSENYIVNGIIIK